MGKTASDGVGEVVRGLEVGVLQDMAKKNSNAVVKKKLDFAPNGMGRH